MGMNEFRADKLIDQPTITGDYRYLVVSPDALDFMVKSGNPPQHYIDLLHKKQLPDELQKGIRMFWAKDEEEAIQQMRETLDD